MTTTRIDTAHQLNGRTVGIPNATRAGAVIAFALGLVIALLLIAPRATAGSDSECPPVSAQLSSAQSGAPTGFNCSVAAAQPNTMASTVGPAPLGDVNVMTLTGTTTQP